MVFLGVVEKKNGGNYKMADEYFKCKGTYAGILLGATIGYFCGSGLSGYADSIKCAPDVLTAFYKALPIGSEVITAAIGASLGGSLGKNVGYVLDGIKS